jgi:hypothetical protein
LMRCAITPSFQRRNASERLPIPKNIPSTATHMKRQTSTRVNNSRRQSHRVRRCANKNLAYLNACEVENSRRQRARSTLAEGRRLVRVPEENNL